MKIRFAVHVTLVSALAFAAALSSAGARNAQRPGEYPNEHHDYVHANGGHIPEAPVRRAPSSRPEVDRRPGGRVNSVPHRTTSVTSSPIPIRYHFERFDLGAHRVWFPGGVSFEIASWDWELASSWC